MNAIGNAVALPDAEVISDWLAETLCDVLGVGPEEIDLNCPFSHYGLGSTEAVMIVGDLETWLGATFPNSLAFDHPTIQSLADHLGDELPRYRAAAS